MSSHAIQGLTFECWFQAATLRRRQVLMELGNNGSLRIGIGPDSSLFVLHNGQETSQVGEIHPGVWYHLSYVHEVGTDEGLVYVNGEQVGTAFVPIGNSDPGVLRLGGSREESDAQFIGYLDEVRLWDGYTSASMLRSWMLRRLTPLHPKAEELLVHYPFDEDPSGSTSLEDKAGAWDATMVGMNPIQQRSISSVPMGDAVSVLDLQDANAPNLRLQHADGDEFSLKNISAASLPRYVYLYRVDEASISENGFFLSRWSDLRYWGVFMGEKGKEVEYTVEFAYEGYPDITSEAGLTLANREQAGAPVWYNTFPILDMQAGMISLEATGNQEWILGEGFPFQIVWEELSARWEEQDIAVEWKVGQEDGVSHYEVERSIDGRMFSRISTVIADPSQSGNYQYLDPSASQQQDQSWFFRIKQVDIQGGFSYSEVVNVQGRYVISGLRTTPNPCTNALLVDLPGGRDQTGIIRLLDFQGKTLQKYSIYADQEQIVMDMQEVQRGLYLIQVHVDQQVWGTKVWKN